MTSYQLISEPDCENEGIGQYTAAFTNPLFSTQTVEVYYEAYGHEYGEPTYVWSEDDSSVTATVECLRNPLHILSETVSTTLQVTDEAGCMDEGNGLYVAEFENDIFETQYKDTIIEALGHDFVQTGIIPATQ